MLGWAEHFGLGGVRTGDLGRLEAPGVRVAVLAGRDLVAAPSWSPSCAVPLGLALNPGRRSSQFVTYHSCEQAMPLHRALRQM